MPSVGAVWGNTDSYDHVRCGAAARNRSCSRRCSPLTVEQVRKLSIATTSQPSASSCSHRCDPRNPAPLLHYLRSSVELRSVVNVFDPTAVRWVRGLDAVLHRLATGLRAERTEHDDDLADPLLGTLDDFRVGYDTVKQALSEMMPPLEG